MLTNISVTEIADARGGFGMGACSPAAAGARRPSGGADAIFARPRAAWAHPGTSPVQPAGQLQETAQPANRKQYAHTTPTAKLSGGTPGPHPPREPA